MRLKEFEVEAMVIGCIAAFLVGILGAPTWAIMGFGIVAALAANKGREKILK